MHQSLICRGVPHISKHHQVFTPFLLHLRIVRFLTRFHRRRSHMQHIAAPCTNLSVRQAQFGLFPGKNKLSRINKLSAAAASLSKFHEIIF